MKIDDNDRVAFAWTAICLLSVIAVCLIKIAIK